MAPNAPSRKLDIERSPAPQRAGIKLPIVEPTSIPIHTNVLEFIIEIL